MNRVVWELAGAGICQVANGKRCYKSRKLFSLFVCTYLLYANNSERMTMLLGSNFAFGFRG